MKTIFISITTFLSFAFTTTIDLIGRWETKPSSTGSVTAAIFKNDNTYEAYKDNQSFVSGTYSFNAADSILTIEDDGCMSMAGSYKVNFFNNTDSIKFTAIIDYCYERKSAIESVVLGKVK